MAGRVDLNLPPRLIESARAAQYVNREVLGARTLEERIKAKARRRQEAAIRANPGLITPQQREGGVLEFQQAPLQRIWRRPRRVGEVDVGIGWYKVLRNTTIITDGYNLRPGVHYEYHSINSITLYLGSSDASDWQTVSFSVTSRNIRYYPNPNIYGESTCCWIDVLFLPAGGKGLAVLIGVHESYLLPTGNKVTTNLSCHALLVTRNQVEMLPVSTLPFFERLASNRNSLSFSDDPFLSGSVLFSAVIDPTMYSAGNPLNASPPQLIGQLPPTHSSSMYEYVRRIDLASTTPPQAQFDWLFQESGSLLSRTEARQLYKQFSGSDQIPVALYKRSDNAPSYYPSPLSEAGELGIIEGAEITDLPFPDLFQSYVPYDIARFDSRENFQVSSSANDPTGTLHTGAQPFPLSSFFGGDGSNYIPHLILAYDYHGGTYCRDQLTALGITLP